MSESTAPPPTPTRTPLVITSFPTIPLTTTFTRGTDCGGIYTPYRPAVFIIDNELSCLPSSFSTSDSSFFYSPGIACPSGYWTACHDTTGVSSITTVTCCPTYADISLTCAPSPLSLTEAWESIFCTWVAPRSPGTVITVTKSADGGRTSTVNAGLTFPGGLNAYGVRMVYQASDMETATSSAASSDGSGAPVPTTSSTADPTGSSSPGASDDPDVADSNSGLSVGEQAAIGVVVPLAVIALLIGLALWWRRRKRQQQLPSAAKEAPTYDYALAAPGAYQPGAEHVAPKPPGEQQQHYYYGGQPQPHEMPTAWTPSEMPSMTSAAELPGPSPNYHPGNPNFPDSPSIPR
ncbi:uncharacterized protein B0H64DRAFT_235117 [Chaetomium fimeti]|uniref:Uncharacterized protein n=1 Tax=Chaetomium fimeti TaxID=1854472 RepID=A0AAE0HAA5_9PEZI|nr:hypothetical protein B0H64DRAFT_235117 [Chaetomium fimeti]